MLLLLVIAGMLYLWKPWAGVTSSANDRTISVSGEATVKAEPDEYSFNPTYVFKNADKAAALKELTIKSSDLVAKLKGLGVEDRNLKSNASGYDYERSYSYNGDTKESSYELTLSVVATNRDKSQKIQDYLVSTNPTGSLSPNVQFSDATRKKLESQARDKATKEARTKADQSAKNLGFRLGAVKAVQDGAGFGNIYPTMGKATLDVAANSPEPKLNVQPGQNELNYSVTVIYFLR